MSKFFSVLLIMAATCVLAFSQDPAPTNDPPSKGVAPKTENGIGRADVRVRDESGNPIKNAYVKLESTRTDGFYCESWNDTDDLGVADLPPIHMGTLKLKIKAKGYHNQELEVPAAQLGEPIRVTLKKK